MTLYLRWLLYLLSFSVAFTTHYLTSSHVLHSWDSVNFALGVERLDLAVHSPHPPGYVGLVILARVLALDGDVPAGLTRVTALAAGVSYVLVWKLVWRTTHSAAASWVAWSVVVSSPLLWFYSSTAEIYALELLAGLLCASAALAGIEHPDKLWPSIGFGCSVIVAVLMKPTVVVLIAPLAIYVACLVPGHGQKRLLIAGMVSICIGLVLLGLVVPLRDVFDRTHDQLVGTLRREASFDASHLLNRRLRDVTYSLMAAMGLGGIVAVPWRTRATPGILPRWFLPLWSAPYALMCIVVHFPKPGYALPLLAPLAVWLSLGYVGRARSLSVGISMAIVTFNTLQFCMQPWNLSQTGGELRYTDKTASQRFLTELNSVLRPSLSTIRLVDQSIGGFMSSVPPQCSLASTVVLVEAGGNVTWRHAMYYLSEAIVFQVGTPDGAVLSARRHTILAESETPNEIVARCVGLVSRHKSTLFLLLGPDVHLTELPDQVVYWTTTEKTVTWTRSSISIRQVETL